MTDRKPCACTSTERCTGIPLPAGFYCRKRQEEADRYDDADDFDELFEPDEYEAFDCYMDREGHCGAAGSEDCEFECPYRRDQYAREREKAKRRRDKNGRQGDMLKGSANDGGSEHG